MPQLFLINTHNSLRAVNRVPHQRTLSGSKIWHAPELAADSLLFIRNTMYSWISKRPPCSALSDPIFTDLHFHQIVVATDDICFRKKGSFSLEPPRKAWRRWRSAFDSSLLLRWLGIPESFEHFIPSISRDKRVAVSPKKSWRKLFISMA